MFLLPAFSVAAEDEIFEEIRWLLSDSPQIEGDERPGIPADTKDYVLAKQPDSGDALLAIISDPNDPLNRRATNAFLRCWESMSPEQIDTYFKVAMTAYTRLRPQYPQGAQAYIGAGYTIRYGWGGWPRVKDIKISTSSYKILDGQVRGQPRGKLGGEPFTYEKHMASTGGIPVEDLGLGTHTVQAVTNYEVTYKEKTYKGTTKSEPVTFEIVGVDTSNELAAPYDAQVDELVRRAFRIESPDWSQQSDGPRSSVRGIGSSDEYGLCMPVYKLLEPLPVDLCFEVELHLDETGEVLEGDQIVVIKGDKHGGGFAAHDRLAFAKITEGLIPLRIVLKPSYDVALGHTRVTQYYNEVLTSELLQARTYWFKLESAKPWVKKLQAMLQELTQKDKIDEQVLYQIENLASVNPYNRARGALTLQQMPDKDITPAIPFLVALLASTETDLEIKAAERAEQTLVAIGAPAVEPVTATLKSEDPYLREAAAYILGSIADRRAVEPLIEALGDPENVVREAAATALGDIKDPRARKPLTAALNDHDLFVRDSAAASLELIENQMKFEAYHDGLNGHRVAVGQFPDTNLERVIRTTISKPTGEINAADLVGRRFIVLNAQSCEIEDLRGLEHCTDLIELRLSNNRIHDLGPLSGLKNLTDLSLGHNKITDSNLIALAGLTNLERLNLDDNQISDVTALASLRKLSRLQIMNNQITGISALSHLTNMTSLWLSGDKIADLGPLASLAKLEHVSFSHSPLRNISTLAALKNLTSLDAANCQLSDISPLSGLGRLTHLDLVGNRIADIDPLSKLTNLTTLELTQNQISDLTPLTNLLKLSSLQLRDNRIGDLKALSNLVELRFLNVSNNPIKDVSPLAGLTNLMHLYIANAQVTDISRFSGLIDMVALDLSGNKISDVSVLANFEQLQFLHLGSNQISDVSVLSGLANLKSIWLERNRITDIKPLADNKSISEGASVNLGGSPLSQESLNVHIPALQARGVKIHNSPLSIR
jgi:internalin A